ncbi:uncharacterized protein At4g26485-like [Amaranthus tricolor]|uniref:uncharacterized protein At4g26485-like n=1 Tax=Amaranthus tricolor TaxID=29722 RepID=UPI00258F131C|nr:uncharacterized protein At4g26485-like [Amaranthus tricolor]
MEGEKWIKHYSSKQKILLIGEGDFSFALSLATAFGNATNIVATSIDSPDMLQMRYAKAKSNLDLLEAYGCNLVYGVDAHTMHKHRALQNQTFDRIVFNFPHAELFLREHKLNSLYLDSKFIMKKKNEKGKERKERGEVGKGLRKGKKGEK